REPDEAVPQRAVAQLVHQRPAAEPALPLAASVAVVRAPVPAGDRGPRGEPAVVGPRPPAPRAPGRVPGVGAAAFRGRQGAASVWLHGRVLLRCSCGAASLLRLFST